MIRIKKLEVEKFRGFKAGSVFEIGQSITLISGLNGTSKSTLLGMLCQPLGFTTKKSKSAYTHVYDECGDLGSLKTLSGAQFKAQYSDVFRVSREFDKPKDHLYSVFMEGESIVSDGNSSCGKLTVQSEGRKDQASNNLRFVTNTDLRDPGYGNFPHPVIYLGLERLRPLATSESVILGHESNLSDEEKEIWSSIYRSVLIVPYEEHVSAQEVDTKGFKKKYQSVHADYFDGESASAGQDNLGQIITAILSFHRLKVKLGTAYQGGVLLIDEFDATLHPIAQIQLLEQFACYSKLLNLQIIATTHSMVALKEACRKFKNTISLLYLQRSGLEVVLNNNVDFEFIQRDLAHVMPCRLVSNDKVTLLFEDAVAATFFRCVTCNAFSSVVAIYNTEEKNQTTSFSNDVLKTIATRIASKDIPEFKRVIYVLDPDSHHLLNKRCLKLLALPGSKPIEEEIYNFLFALSKEHPFWSKSFMTWSMCFDDGFYDIPSSRQYQNNDERLRAYKRWFLSKIVQSKCFGKGGLRAFKEWRIAHINDCRLFCEELLKALKSVVPAVYSENGKAIVEILKTKMGGGAVKRMV